MKSFPRYVIRRTAADDWEIIEVESQALACTCTTRREARAQCRQMNEAKANHDQNIGTSHR